MTITAADVQEMIGTALKQVRAGWKPTPKGSYLSTLVAENQPPLTTGAVDMYLGFYGWLWDRELPADEVKRMNQRLTQDSETAWARMDWSVRDAVLATCALWDQIRQRPEQEQEEIRSFLQQEIEPGSYPELEGRASPAPSGDLDEVMNRSAGMHNRVMDVLRNWPDLPG